MKKADAGLIGLGVMGMGLARNCIEKGIHLSIYNRTREKIDELMGKWAANKERVTPTYSLEEFISSLEKPRNILLLVRAGNAVDEILEKLIPLLEKGDIVVDCGNSYFLDTERREDFFKQRGLHFVGMGISGGEQGALKGPSLMPGGSSEAWKRLKPVLERLAADDFYAGKCVTHIGERGAGHFIKMIHNGIEYADMQQISEIYDVLKVVYSMSNKQIADIFEQWNAEKLSSFLTETTVEVLKKKDELSSGDLVESILDVADQKGTGIWTVQTALDLGESAGSMAEALFMRFLSTKKQLRTKICDHITKPKWKPGLARQEFTTLAQDAFLAARISNYAQGFDLMHSGDNRYQFGLNYGEIARIWQGGCIIRTKLLKDIYTAFHEKRDAVTYQHLFLASSELTKKFTACLPALRTFVVTAVYFGVPIPSMMASLSYIDAISAAKLPINLIQALRDNFGAHTYSRSDRGGTFHTQW